MLIHYEGDTPALEDDAKGILSLIWASYPNHPWSVRCMKGMVFIRHLDFPPNWGAALRVSEVDHDTAVFKKKIIMGAGELLERARLKRGAGEAEQEVGQVEGVPKKYQQHQPLTDDIKLVMPDEITPLRSQPRPQALKDRHGN